MILSKKGITKALISLQGCTGWSAPLLFANHEDRFSHIEAHKQTCKLRLLKFVVILINNNKLREMHFKFLYIPKQPIKMGPTKCIAHY